MTNLQTKLSPLHEEAFELELAQLIVEAVNLEIAAGEIDPAAPLFKEGLGLDSIDMLEIALAVSQRYGCSLRSDGPENASIFSSLHTLADYISCNRTK